ncbi:nitrate- and nitrite sensing domain-containing protein [Nonomuraea dietziae]|uniref:nitrate- and nitrite sensing domain-containing protein n=1 Tax=Nonomuraea dietziae TaxID=65515 RepID=UPI00361A7AB7
MARSRTIRVKIVGLLLVPLVSMVTLWVIIVAVTAGESLELRSYKERWTNLRQPASKLISELQRERLSSASLVVDRATADEQAEAYTQRARTDTARERFRQLSELSRGSSTPAVRTEIDTVLTQLAHLEGIRGEIDAGLSPILPTIEAYNAISDALFGLQRSVALIDDIPIYEQSRLVINLGYAKELLTREQAIAVGDPGEEERKLFTQLVGNRRFLIDQALAELDAPLREIQVGIITSPAYQRLRIMEEQIIAGHAPADWPTASDALATTIQEAQNSASVLLSERAEPVADAVLVRALVLAGTGLVVVVVSIVISLRMGNRLSRELGTLRQAALEVAESRLPQVVRKLRQGEEVEVPALTVPGRTAEIQDVGKAFATVQQTAVEAAVGEAKLRAGVGQVFRNLARRSQTLLHRQRIQLDGMQRTATDPQALDDLFRLDHLTTRMRRHAEGLIILSGAVPGRGWRKPVPLHDVVRGASAEVEDYTRVSVSPCPTTRWRGPWWGTSST